jgi:hypothetical protein
MGSSGSATAFSAEALSGSGELAIFAAGSGGCACPRHPPAPRPPGSFTSANLRANVLLAGTVPHLPADQREAGLHGTVVLADDPGDVLVHLSAQALVRKLLECDDEYVLVGKISLADECVHGGDAVSGPDGQHQDDAPGVRNLPPGISLQRGLHLEKRLEKVALFALLQFDQFSADAAEQDLRAQPCVSVAREEDDRRIRSVHHGNPSQVLSNARPKPYVKSVPGKMPGPLQGHHDTKRPPAVKSMRGRSHE